MRPGELRNDPGESAPYLRARFFGIQWIVHDILRYTPKAIRIFNADFFLSSTNYKENYKASKLLAGIGPFSIGADHDCRADFEFTKRLRDYSLISGDAVVDQLLDRSREDYLAGLDHERERSAAEEYSANPGASLHEGEARCPGSFSGNSSASLTI